jgi:hypothetical protein
MTAWAKRVQSRLVLRMSPSPLIATEQPTLRPLRISANAEKPLALFDHLVGATQ